MVTITETDGRIAASAAAITDRAGRWSTIQVGRHRRTVPEVADDLRCDWHTVMDAVNAFGAALIDDPYRIRDTTAIGLDEVLFCRLGRFRQRCWSTQIVDVAHGQLCDVVPGRDATCHPTTCHPTTSRCLPPSLPRRVDPPNPHPDDSRWTGATSPKLTPTPTRRAPIP